MTRRARLFLYKKKQPAKTKAKLADVSVGLMLAIKYILAKGGHRTYDLLANASDSNSLGEETIQSLARP